MRKQQGPRPGIHKARSLAWIIPGCVLAIAASSAAAQTAEAPAAAQHHGENGSGRADALQMSLTYDGDLLADVAGGAGRGVMYDGRLGLILDSDLHQAFGWRGASAHLSLHLITGTGPSGDRVGNLLTVSGLEARPTLRLFNLWVQQSLGDRSSLRVGQFTAAQEFVVSPTANLFVNSTFGWPASFAVDLPSGGPAYPLAAPGARLSFSPAKSTTVLAAVFAGDPAGPGPGDPQRRDRSGLNSLRFSGRPFLIAEMQRPLGPSANAPMLKVGGWKHLDPFEDLRLDEGGLSLADPASSGVSRRHGGNSAVYAILDGPLIIAGPRTLSGFFRVTASPSDRNRIDRYLDVGLSLSGPFPGRPDDTLGVAAGVARISPQARALAAETNAVAGENLALPGREAVFEATYQFKLRSAVFIQPDLQYIRRPNGGAADPITQRPLKSALVAGVRTAVRF